jgi:hypothetical protein
MPSTKNGRAYFQLKPIDGKTEKVDKIKFCRKNEGNGSGVQTFYDYKIEIAFSHWKK